MTWTETYKKYKHTKLMQEFDVYLLKELEIPEEVLDMCGDNSKFNIKDIWGYLICFAETKKIAIRLLAGTCGVMNEHYTAKSDNDTEEMMLWCADKFFEVAE